MALRVLCFGDSLTSGYHHYGLGEQPYSDALAARLRAALPAVAVDVVTSGVPGDFAALPAFRSRLERECAARPYDWVIILGGTNDLALHFPAANILDGLRACWSIALARGASVLALTVPENHSRSDRLNDLRRELNRAILAHEQPNFHALDLLSKIPFHALSESDRDTYWDDGVHLTADGYDWMGGHIADGLLHILSQQGMLPPKDGDDEQFDEETGSPADISRGYVVVRKSDLD